MRLRMDQHDPQQDSPDLPDRGERYVAAVYPYWETLKASIRARVAEFNSNLEPHRRVRVEEGGRRLMVRGDACGLDITFRVELEQFQLLYTWRRSGQWTKRAATARIDMRECLVILDRQNRIVEDPAGALLKPFFRNLTAPSRPWW